MSFSFPWKDRILAIICEQGMDLSYNAVAQMLFLLSWLYFWCSFIISSRSRSRHLAKMLLGLDTSHIKVHSSGGSTLDASFPPTCARRDSRWWHRFLYGRRGLDSQLTALVPVRGCPDVWRVSQQMETTSYHLSLSLPLKQIPYSIHNGIVSYADS